MRIFGIKIELRRETKWVPRDEFRVVSEAFQNAFNDLKKYADDIADGVETNRKAIDAYRKKLDKYAAKSNGDLEAEFKSGNQAENQPPAPVDYSNLPTGTPVNF